MLPELAHPDFVWDTTTFRGGIQLATCVGIDETNRWLAEWLEGFDTWSIEVLEVVEAGDQVVTVSRQRAKPKHGGPEVEMRLAQVWTFRDGLIARMEMYADRAEALRAVGVSVGGAGARRARPTACPRGRPRARAATHPPRRSVGDSQAQLADLTAARSQLSRQVAAGSVAPCLDPVDCPMTSSMISSVPAPIRLRRWSRNARSISYSFM